MGFDLYGLNPTNPKGLIKPEIDWTDKPSDKERDEFFTDLNDYEDKVPGHYFRNNVWYWRPLWQFVMSSCDDILTDEDCEEGSSNGGHEISEDKALAIADKIDELDKNGTIDFYSKRVEEIRKKGEKHNKKIEVKKETLRKKVNSHMESDKIVPAHYPEPYKSMWDKLQDQEDWGAHYPFDADNVREFGKFCKESGGFEIC